MKTTCNAFPPYLEDIKIGKVGVKCICGAFQKNSEFLGGVGVKQRVACRPKGASVVRTNLIFFITDSKDDVETLAFGEGHPVFLFIVPPAILKCVELNFALPIKQKTKLEGNVGTLMVITGKVQLEPGRGEETRKGKLKGRCRNLFALKLESAECSFFAYQY